MEVEERVRLAARNAAEIVTVEELRRLFETTRRPTGYLGFEPSGLFHIGWIIWARKVQDLLDAGVEFTLLEATWHAWINDKLGGDLGLIRKAARYVRLSLKALGVEADKIHWVDAEKLVSDKDYWAYLVRVAKNASLARIKRALTIMGRRADEAETDFSKLIYPCMQVADIYYLDVDIALGGTDQRKAHMLARDIAEKLGRKKPVAIHTPLLTGLQGAGRMDSAAVDEETHAVEYKMSKSRPETTIFIHDTAEEIRAKLRRAYCPPREARYNPVMEINRYILFTLPGFVLHIDRPSKYGGPIDVESYEELERLYKAGELHPLDLKNATAEALAKYLEPVRRMFREDPEARGILEELSRAAITR